MCGGACGCERCVCVRPVCVCAGLRPGHRARSLGLGTRVWPSAAPPQGGQVVYGSAGSTPAVNFASWSGPQTILFFPSSRCGRPVPAGRGTKASLAEARGHRMLDCLPGHSGDATEADTQVARPAAGASARGLREGRARAGREGGAGRAALTTARRAPQRCGAKAGGPHGGPLGAAGWFPHAGRRGAYPSRALARAPPVSSWARH